MASLMEDPEAVGKTSEETPEKAAAEKKREKNRRKKAAQKAKKKKEATLAAEQSAQRALDNRKVEGDLAQQEKSKKKEPLIKKYLTEEDIKNAEDAKLLQKERNLLVNLGGLSDLENMTDEQIDALAASIAHNAHSRQARWGGRKRKRTKKRRKTRKRKRKIRRKRKTRRKRRKRR